MSTMSDLCFPDLEYLPDQLSDEIWAAAHDAAAACGYDRFEEVLLHAEAIDVCRVAASSVEQHYAWIKNPPAAFPYDEVVRVDWRTWAVPKNFSGAYEDAIIGREESIIVAIRTLIAREVFTYGLGPEYNWLQWQETSQPDGEPPPEAFSALCSLIRGDWSYYLPEYADGEEDYLEGIHPALREAVAEVISQADDD